MVNNFLISDLRHLELRHVVNYRDDLRSRLIMYDNESFEVIALRIIRFWV